MGGSNQRLYLLQIHTVISLILLPPILLTLFITSVPRKSSISTYFLKVFVLYCSKKSNQKMIRTCSRCCQNTAQQFMSRLSTQVAPVIKNTPGSLAGHSPIELQRVRHDWSNLAWTHARTPDKKFFFIFQSAFLHPLMYVYTCFLILQLSQIRTLFGMSAVSYWKRDLHYHFSTANAWQYCLTVMWITGEDLEETMYFGKRHLPPLKSLYSFQSRSCWSLDEVKLFLQMKKIQITIWRVKILRFI